MESLCTGEFGDCLCPFRNSMLGKFTWKDKTHSCLYLPACDGGLLIVSCKSSSFLGKLLKYIVDEGIHDTHGLGRDTCVRVHLLEHLEDVDLVGLDALL